MRRRGPGFRSTSRFQALSARRAAWIAPRGRGPSSGRFHSGRPAKSRFLGRFSSSCRRRAAGRAAVIRSRPLAGSAHPPMSPSMVAGILAPCSGNTSSSPLRVPRSSRRIPAPRRPTALNELGAQGWEAVGLTLKQGDLGRVASGSAQAASRLAPYFADRARSDRLRDTGSRRQNDCSPACARAGVSLEKVSQPPRGLPSRFANRVKVSTIRLVGRSRRPAARCWP